MACLATGSVQPTSGEKPDPVAVVAEPPKEPDIEQWAQAYEALGAPEILVLCGWSTGGAEQSSVADTYFGRGQNPFSVQLQGAFVEVINDPRADAYIVDDGALRDTVQRLSTNLANSGEAAAIRLLGNELKADVVVQIQLLDKRASDGAPVQVRFQTVDVSSGRAMTTRVFDWKLGTSTADVKSYGRQIARAFIEDMSGRSLNVQSYNLRVFGLGSDPRTNKALKDRIESTNGVKDVRARSGATERNPISGINESMVRYAVKYTGDFMDLAAEVTEHLSGSPDFRVRLIEASGRQVSLQVREVPKPAPEVKPDPEKLAEDRALRVRTYRGCLDLILEKDIAGDEQRQYVYDLYRKQDSPSIAVLINRQPTPNEWQKAADEGRTTAADTVVLVNVNDRSVNGSPVSAAPADASTVRRITMLERQTNLVESALFKRLGPDLLRFERKDASSARQQLAAEMDKQGNVFGQDELVRVLKNLNLADIVIIGTGADLPDADGRLSLTYTFRAIQLSDAGVLGVASAREPVDGRTEQEIAEAIADQAIRSLVCEMKQSWEPPNNLDVMLTNLNSTDDLELFIKAINARESEVGSNGMRVVGRTSFEGALGQGTAQITVSYGCSFNDLLPEIRAIAGELPFGLDIQSIDAGQAKLAIVY